MGPRSSNQESECRIELGNPRRSLSDADNTEQAEEHPKATHSLRLSWRCDPGQSESPVGGSSSAEPRCQVAGSGPGDWAGLDPPSSVRSRDLRSHARAATRRPGPQCAMGQALSPAAGKPGPRALSREPPPESDGPYHHQGAPPRRGSGQVRSGQVYYSAEV
jgi:hypothetical protein